MGAGAPAGDGGAFWSAGDHRKCPQADQPARAMVIAQHASRACCSPLAWPTFAPTTWAFFIAWASQPTGASNIRPVPKPPRVGIDRSSDHTVDLARCGELIGRGIGGYTPGLPQRRARNT